MVRPSRLVGICALGCALAGGSPANAGDMTGTEEADVGAGVPGHTYKGKNNTGEDIHDFTFELVGDCGANLSWITVRHNVPNPQYSDWDVDDDMDGESQEDPNEDGNRETGDEVGEAGVGASTARVDNQGTQSEGGAGKPIKEGESFEIQVWFTQTTTSSCTLKITPTNDLDCSYCSLSDGIQSGPNECAVDNGTSIFPCTSSAAVNATGAPIEMLGFETTGDYLLEEVYQFNPETGDVLTTVFCGSVVSCDLILAAPVPPGGVVGLGAMFDQHAPGEVTLLTITPVLGVPGPTGVCCLPEQGTCADAYVDATCLLADGTYMGDGTTCGPTSCEVPMAGACCLLDGTCEETSEYGCVDTYGTYMGDGTMCSGVECPQPTPMGACCLEADELCEHVLTETECGDFLGDYMGDDTDCVTTYCAYQIPALSQWGVVAVMALVLAAGTVVLVRRRVARG
jgi:hypothetical protein